MASRLTHCLLCNRLWQRRCTCTGLERWRNVIVARHYLELVSPMLSYTWPEDFPEGCPPEQASRVNGTYYRIVKNDPPESGDFVSNYHLNQKRAEREISRGRRTQCETMGLSVYTESVDAIQCAQQFPKLGSKIAHLFLTPASGTALKTGSGWDSHNTWWKPQGFDPVGSAQVILPAEN